MRAPRAKTVGIIAVDPSSPVSGGAILGDRIRMTATLDDDGVFMRSLASRGHLGGLSPAAVRIIDALDAAGKDVILIETVGTGQSEIDVAEVADVRILVTAPGLGDDIQAMKAGLIEMADVMVVNKADREGAERAVQQLKGALSLRAHDRHKVPVLKTTATSGAGVEALAEAIGGIAAVRLGRGARAAPPPPGALPDRACRRRSRGAARARRWRPQARSAGRRPARRHADCRGRGAPAALRAYASARAPARSSL